MSVCNGARFLACLAASFVLSNVTYASTITMVALRSDMTETDFIDWGVVDQDPATSRSPVSSTTNGGVSFVMSQPNSNPLNCESPGTGCLRYDVTGPDGSTGVRGFDTFSDITLSFGSGFTAVGFDGLARQSTTFFLTVTHGGVTDPQIQFSPNGAAVFLGVQSTANDITQIVMHITGAGFSGIGNGDYDGLDRVSLTGAVIPPSAPEPGTFGIMLAGGAVLAAIARCRARH